MFFMNSKYIVLTFFIIHTFKIISGANILALSPLHSKSHSAMMQELAKGLAERGHNVDVVSHFPLEEPLNGYNEINIKGSSASFVDAFSYDFSKSQKGGFLIELMIEKAGLDPCRSAFKSPQLQQLKNSTKTYDLLIVEIFSSDCMIGWSWYLKIPTVMVSSSIPLPWHADAFGLPDNPAYIPTYFVEYSSDMSLYQRMVNTWNLIQAKFLFKANSMKPSEILAREFFGEKMPPLRELAYNSSLLMINTHFSIQDPRPLPPSVIEVGGLHISTPEPLNEHFNKVLETKMEGIIYFSLGSIVATETIPSETLQEMFDALSSLPYKVLWRAKKEQLPKGLKIPSDIHFEIWMPQLSILCDPRVKLFISHGGMMGIQEAVYCGVPVLGLPLFADQESNIRHAEILGFGLRLPDISKTNLLEYARKLLLEPSYADNAKRISQEFKDRPISARDTAIYWTEYVIRHKGAPRLQGPAKYLPWYKYYLIDIMAIVIIVFCITAYVLMLILGLALRLITMKTKVKIN